MWRLSVMVSLPNSHPEGTGFVLRQTLYLIVAHGACYPFGTSKLALALSVVDVYESRIRSYR
jgi:hypothetical protein